MTTKIEQTTARQADVFETTLKSARVPEELHDGFWDLWVANPLRATALARRLAPPPAVVTKAATPGMQVIELPIGLAQALTAMRGKVGDDQLIQLMTQASGGFIPSGGGKKSDLDGVQTKSAQPGSLGSILDGASAYIQSAGNGWPIRERE
jgi:hypothetical protein